MVYCVYYILRITKVPVRQLCCSSTASKFFAKMLQLLYGIEVYK